MFYNAIFGCFLTLPMLFSCVSVLRNLKILKNYRINPERHLKMLNNPEWEFLRSLADSRKWRCFFIEDGP